MGDRCGVDENNVRWLYGESFCGEWLSSSSTMNRVIN